MGTLALIKEGTKELNLRSQGLTSKDAETLAEKLKFNKSLTVLDLADNNLGLDGAKIIIDVLKSNATLQKLNLENNNISCSEEKTDEEKVTQLFAALKSNGSLKELNLSKNNLGFYCLTAIKSVIQQNNSLECINLDKNGMADLNRIRTLFRFISTSAPQWTCEVKSDGILLVKNVGKKAETKAPSTKKNKTPIS